MPPESTLGSEGHAAARTIQILVASAIRRCHGDIQSQAAAEGHVCVCGPTAARVCINVCGITKVHAKCQGTGLPPGIMLVPSTTLKAYVDVHGPCYQRGP